MAKTKKPFPINVTIAGEGKDEWRNRYFKFVIEDSKTSIPPFSVGQIIKDPKPLYTALSNAGGNMMAPQAQAELRNRTQNYHAKPSFTVATRIGWHGLAYVFPNQIVGKPPLRIEKSFGDIDPQMLAKYRVRGTLESWKQSVASLCSGNSRLMFAASLAFTGPILSFVSGEKSGGFQLYGKGETGKTTAAMVAGSVWGCHRDPAKRQAGFCEKWNTTVNELEVTALAHNDALLILDETKLAAGKEKDRADIVLDVVFRIDGMIEKARMTNVGSPRSWRCYFLSTSNLPLEQLARPSRHIAEEDRGRLVDIPLPSDDTICEELHEFVNAEDFTTKLKNRCRNHYGAPIREFVSRLVAVRQNEPKYERFQQAMKKWREQYKKTLNERLRSVRPENRATSRFATVFAAGRLAIYFGILPWKPQELLQAILSCQLDGLKKPVTTEDTVIAAMDKKMADYMRKNRTKFIDLRKGWLEPGAHKFESVLGFIAKHKGYMYCYLTAEKLNLIIGTGDAARRYKQSLVDRGRLDVSSGGAGGRRFVVERRIFTGKSKDGMKSVHAIKLKPVKR